MSKLKEQLFNDVEKAVRKKENYVPRNFQTIGGMWTTDTWKYGEVTFQVMDEGYTTRISTDKLDVWDSMSGIRFEKGGIDELLELRNWLLEGK